jgi:hypothetical protein
MVYASAKDVDMSGRAESLLDGLVYQTFHCDVRPQLQRARASDPVLIRLRGFSVWFSNFISESEAVAKC